MRAMSGQSGLLQETMLTSSKVFRRLDGKQSIFISG